MRTPEGYRQKGVDILMSIDMLTKAYDNHYDIAVLLAGDGDFVELVEAIKDKTGKQVIGLYIPGHVSDKLCMSLDIYAKIPENILNIFQE